MIFTKQGFVWFTAFMAGTWMTYFRFSRSRWDLALGIGNLVCSLWAM